MKVTGLDHVQLAMPPGEEKAARWFYGKVLSLSEVPKPPELVPRGGCWFRGQGVELHLGVQQDFAPARKAHPAFLVADLEDARQKLENAGISVLPDEAVPGVRRFYASDPFGNRLEFIQDGDGFGQR